MNRKAWWVMEVLFAASVMALAACGGGGGGGATGGTPSQPPAPPTGLTATALSSSSIQLAWTDNSSDETGFNIERSSTSDTSGFTLITTIGANVTSYTDSAGLAGSTTYWYRVSANNAAGNSSYSNVASAATMAPPATPPAAPTGLTATALSSSSIQLAWTDNSSDETGFKVERSSTSSTSGFSLVATVGAHTASYTDSTGLAASTTYWYRVYAYNSAGNSSYTNVASAATQSASSVPAAPTLLNATATSSSSIQLVWTDNANNETAYYVERASTCVSAFSQIASLSADAQGYENTGLSASTSYCYRVRAYNGNGYSGYSNTSSATTQASTVCTANTTRCVAGDITAVQTCNASGTGWTQSTCPNWKLCSNSACRTICDITSTPAYPTICMVPNNDGVNNGEWMTWYDNTLTVPTYVTGQSQAGTGGQASVYSSGLTWPYAWYISYQDYIGMWFKLNQFGTQKTPVFNFKAKRANIFSYTSYFTGYVYNVNTLIDSGEWGPVPSSWGTSWFNTSTPQQLNYSGGWNSMYLSVTGDGWGDPIDPIDVNYVYLTIQP